MKQFRKQINDQRREIDSQIMSLQVRQKLLRNIDEKLTAIQRIINDHPCNEDKWKEYLEQSLIKAGLIKEKFKQLKTSDPRYQSLMQSYNKLHNKYIRPLIVAQKLYQQAREIQLSMV